MLHTHPQQAPVNPFFLWRLNLIELLLWSQVCVNLSWHLVRIWQPHKSNHNSGCVYFHLCASHKWITRSCHPWIPNKKSNLSAARQFLSSPMCPSQHPALLKIYLTFFSVFNPSLFTYQPSFIYSFPTLWTIWSRKCEISPFYFDFCLLCLFFSPLLHPYCSWRAKGSRTV